jgi:phthalate 4,5-dioxygenase
MLLETVKKHQSQGVVPISVALPETYMVRAVSLTLPKDVAWQEAGQVHMTARLDADFGYQP